MKVLCIVLHLRNGYTSFEETSEFSYLFSLNNELGFLCPDYSALRTGNYSARNHGVNGIIREQAAKFFFFFRHVRLDLGNVPKVEAKARRRPPLGWEFSPQQAGPVLHQGSW